MPWTQVHDLGSTHATARARRARLIDDHAYARLVEAASEPYRVAGRFAWRFARGKLLGDPVFRYLLEARLIPEGARVLDLGCGQGLLGALLAATDVRTGSADHEGWNRQGVPSDRPRIAAYRGIEMMASDVARAQRALGPGCGVEAGDIRSVELGVADAIVILDVLHYMDRAAQDDVLRRVRRSLDGGGVLLLRVGDASAGLPFRVSNWVDRSVALARGHGATLFHCRSVAQWRAALEALDFSVQTEPMSRGTPFANVLLCARR
ncbi:MAG: class I SAM-dependent methyltransferase [Deltaproteobacteria bacterium]|nr:class I SAM-dependent methyltransferase [Deltaproteobacteria bacterium]